MYAKRQSLLTCTDVGPEADIVGRVVYLGQLICVGYVTQVSRVEVQLVHDVGSSHGGNGIGWEIVARLPASAILEIPCGIVEHGGFCIAIAGQVGDEGFGRVLACLGEVLDGALGRVPRRNGNKGVVLVARQVF